jgi:hypothetical protein
MTEIRSRKSLVPDDAPAAKAPAKSGNTNRTRIIVLTCGFVLLAVLVAYVYWPPSTPPDELPDPAAESTPQPPQPGQPRPTNPTPGQQPIPRDIISG